MKKILSFFMLFAAVMMCFNSTLSSQTVWTAEMVKNTTSNVKEITEYVASDGSNWKVGQRITFGNATGMGVFTYVSMGDGMMSVIQQAPAAWSGKEAEIKKIRISGTKRTGYTLWVTCKGPMQPFHISLEKAIEVGEVVTDGYSSDKALAELKKAKDKLDLGLITIEEFETLKSELSKYIK
jgi:hypothetical protein